MKTDIKSMTVAELEQLLDNIGEKNTGRFRYLDGYQEAFANLMK